MRPSLVLSLIFLFLLQGCSDSNPRPNILLILLDDAGYSDVAGFSPESTAPTPRLNQLANEGVRFTRFYADSTCQPARLSLMTGQQANRVATPPDFTGISPEVETLAEKLQQAGYETFHVGKWHLGETTPLAWPSAQGFDHWFGFLNQFMLRGPDAQGNIKYRRPTYENPWLQRDDAAAEQHQGHLEDLLADEVVKTIRGQAGSRDPWFINYWTFAPHNPALASETYLKQFPDTPAGKYQALLKQVDDNVARILQALEETGQTENTLVVVLSDNGGTNERAANNAPYGGMKGLYSEGGTRVPMMMYGPKLIPSHKRYDQIATVSDLYPTLLSVAGVSLTGVTVAHHDGVDLLPLLEANQPRPPQTLFWEMATHLTHQYSVLSADGRWRLDDGRLYDLEKDPSAQTDVAASMSEMYQDLRQKFLDWRRDVHRMQLSIESLTTDALKNGTVFRVTGESFRRSPGDGPFTFVTSVTPVAGVTPQGVIAEQKNMWSLTLQEDQRLRLRMHDQEFTSEPLIIQGCTPLVLSAYYSRSGIQPQQDVGVWFIWAGGRQLLLEQAPKPSLFPGFFLEPTWVGQGVDGSNPLTATLESPQFYNEFYFLHDPWQVERKPHELAERMCGNTH